MSKSWKIVLGIAAVVGLLAVAGAAVAVAQGPSWTPTQNNGGWVGPWGGLMGPRWGRGPVMGPGWGMRGESLIDVAAEVLQMARTDLIAELQAGKSIAELAEARGIEPQTIVDAFLADRREFLLDLVESGRLTQEQADLMLDHMAEEVTERLDEAGLRGPGPYEGCPMFGTGQTSQGQRGGRAFMMGR